MRLAFTYALLFLFNTTWLHADEEAWRLTPPVLKGTAWPKLPTYEKTQLPNGLSIIVSRKAQLPIAVARLVVRAGASEDPASLSGLASMTLNILDESSAGQNALEVADAFAQLGTSLESSISQDAATMSLSVLAKNLGKGLQLMSNAVIKPSFELSDFDRIKEENMSDLLASRADPTTLAMETFCKTAYGKTPYGHPITGSIDNVADITLKDVKAFWKRHYVPSQTALIIVGDITLKEAKQLANRYFGKWRGKASKKVIFKPLQMHKEGNIVLVERGSSPQTVMVVGRPLWNSKQRYKPADIVLNEIVAGMFSSRLNTSLRQRRAWTYGVQSGISALVGTGPWLIYSNIQVPYAPDALQEIFEEFGRLRKDGVTQEELELAKDNFIKSFAGRFETLGGISKQAASLFLLGLPHSFFAGLLKRINAVTVKQVNEAIQTDLNPHAFTCVLVGELDNMEGPVRSLKLGQVTVVHATNT